MGEPAQPTPAERKETRELAARIVESVHADARMPHGLTAMPLSHLPGASQVFDKDDVEDLVFRLAQEIELLRARGVVAIKSQSDPEPRATSDGRVVFGGHLGIIYQATNGRYVGKTNAATRYLLPDGTCFSNRAAGKLRKGECGRRYAARQLVRWGADPLEPGEDVREWLAYWTARLTRTVRHRGNYRYVWCLDRRRRREVLRREALPYPKFEARAA